MVLAACQDNEQLNAKRQVFGLTCHVKHSTKRQQGTSKIKHTKRQNIALQTNGGEGHLNHNVKSLSHASLGRSLKRATNFLRGKRK